MTASRTYITTSVDPAVLEAKREERLQRAEDRRQRELAVRAELIPLLSEWERDQVKKHGAVVSRHVILGDWLYTFADGKADAFLAETLESDAVANKVMAMDLSHVS
jgi:hypothetical protein